MAYRDMPDCVVPPSHLRCEAMTKGNPTTYQVWMREPHRCVRHASQSRAGHIVCSTHARMKEVSYWSGELDSFPHKKFWKWNPRAINRILESANRGELNVG